MMGQLASQVNGGWQVPNFATYAPDLQWGIGTIPIPTGGQKANYGGGHAWVIPKGAAHPDEAFEFIEYMHTTENQMIAALGDNNVPARISVAESDEFLDGEPTDRTELRRLMVEEVANAKWVPIVPGFSEIIASNQRAFDEVMRKVTTPEQAVATMADECQAILDAAWS
jgi:ABC-type glycerol-3-phosphate transport system substrate-binding protein